MSVYSFPPNTLRYNEVSQTNVRRAIARLVVVQKERCNTTISDHLTAYMSLFLGRKDDYAVQLPDGRYRRVGKPLEASDVFDHLMGIRSYGTYVTNERGCCCFAVFDADNQQGLDFLWNLHDGLMLRNTYCYMEAS